MATLCTVHDHVKAPIFKGVIIHVPLALLVINVGIRMIGSLQAKLLGMSFHNPQC